MGDSDVPPASGEDLYSDDRIKVADAQTNDTQAVAQTETSAQPESSGLSNDNETEAPNVVKNEPVAASTDKPAKPLTFRERLEQARIAKGLQPTPRPPNRSGELEEGDIMLDNGLSRFVIKRANNTAVKYGSDNIMLGDVAVMRFAKAAGIPVPNIISYGQTEDGRKNFIEMEYIEGDTLERVFEKLSDETRTSIAHQLRDILKIMRALPPPPNFIGAFSREELREFRKNDVFRRPPCHTEQDFNNYLTEDRCIPASIKRGYLEGIGTNYKVVFSHCDLAARNIIVRDGRIAAVLDWEASGWYPEYWEYVKFYHMAGRERHWRTFAEEVFPQAYNKELVLYTGLYWYQDMFDSTKAVRYTPAEDESEKRERGEGGKKEVEEKDEAEEKDEDERKKEGNDKNWGKEEKEVDLNAPQNLDAVDSKPRFDEAKQSDGHVTDKG